MRTVALILAALAFPALGAASGDPTRGEKVFRKCKSCHQVGEGASHRLGPSLNGVVDAKIAAQQGFRYSDALRILGDAGTVWTTEVLDAFLTNPRTFARGTKMTYKGLSNEEERADLIAYLGTFGPTGEAAVFAVAPEVLAIEGDAEYGEFLSSECTTCHHTKGQDAGIPNIVGLAPEYFVTALHAYKTAERENPVMRVITARLTDEEIAALAAYFSSLEN